MARPRRLPTMTPRKAARSIAGLNSGLSVPSRWSRSKQRLKASRIRGKKGRRQKSPIRTRPRMNRTEFIIATAIVLFVAFCMGWFANWLVHRFIRVGAADVGELERMAQELHEAEETRDQAITYLQQREAELTNQLSQTEAELAATMEGLREARYEAEQLRAELERNRAG